MEENYDVIIIGGGFSGLIAARELGMLGHNVVVLEARDRLGGRAWTDHRLGCDLEMGGTYVHWYQPHIWTEITRYDMEVISSPEPKYAYWISNGQLKKGTVDEVYDNIKEEMSRLMSESKKYLPSPYKSLDAQTLRDMDAKSFTEYVKEFDFPKEELDIMHGLVATDFSGPPEQVALSQVFRKWAFSKGIWDLHLEVVSGFKLKNGTSALIDSIAADVNADIELSTIVRKIEHEEGNVVVQTECGQQYSGRAVIVTVPLTALNNVEFQPPLSLEKQNAIEEARKAKVSKGVKVWARLKGIVEPFVTFAPGDYPLNSAQVEDTVNGDTIVVAFGISEEDLDPCDRSAVEKGLRYWIPDVKVIESTGHEWVKDEFSQQTWPVLTPNNLARYSENFRDPEQGVYFAGSTFANGWISTLDGAIETGIRASRKISKSLSKN